MIQYLIGPEGLSIELDTEQVFPDDPGQGTPVLVVWREKYTMREETASYNCAVGTGELGFGDYVLNADQRRWLDDQRQEVEEFFEENNTVC